MNKTGATGLTILAAICAVAIPVLIALKEARRQALDNEIAQVLSYARDVVHRTDATADQADAGIEIIHAGRRGDPCSAASIAPMREVDVASSYVQAIGYVSDDRLVCSSLGTGAQHLPLGPVDLVTSRGARLRLNVELPFATDRRFLVIERDHYAAIIHKDLLIDVTAEESGVQLASILTDDRRIMARRGDVKPDWLTAVRRDAELTFVRDGFVVAVVPSTHHDTAAIAAVPLERVNERVRALAALLVPIGVLAGGVLALAVVRLARSQLAMPGVLKTALRRGEFHLAYQPYVDLRTGRWAGAEMLIRWRRPSGDLVRPDLFIPVAEDAGLIGRLTERVAQLAARDAADLFQQFPDFSLSVNVSSAELHARRTLDLLRGLATDLHAGRGNLVVEVTERGLLEPGAAREVLRDLRAGGIRVAIDDFGTGFSSLSYLQTFELDFLKIDKSFVDALGTDAPTSGVAFQIIEMGKTLKLDMIAEGVETDAQARSLRDHGVQFAQGWHFASPMSYEMLVRGLSTAARVDRGDSATVVARPSEAR